MNSSADGLEGGGEVNRSNDVSMNCTLDLEDEMISRTCGFWMEGVLLVSYDPQKDLLGSDSFNLCQIR